MTIRCIFTELLECKVHEKYKPINMSTTGLKACETCGSNWVKIKGAQLKSTSGVR